MEDKILILGIKSYCFKNDNGEEVSGTKVSYISKYANENGHLPIQISVPDIIAKDITIFPAIYTCNYAMLPGKGNKPTATIVGFKFEKSYKFEF